MPNGGPRPDCVHCKQYKGRPFTETEPYCSYHNMNLPVSIYAFCPDYVDPDPQGLDWLDEELDRNSLQKEMMYLWITDSDENIFYVPLVPIEEYRTWNEERFTAEVRKIMDKYRKA